MSNETLALFIVIVLVVIALPAWPYSKSWGYRPISVLTVLLIIFLIWAIAAGRPLFRSTVEQDLTAAGRDMADSIRRAVQ